MKKLVLRIFVLIIIVFTLSAVMRFSLSSFWGHPTARMKCSLFSEEKDGINTVFIGSSRIFRHVIPKQFDSLGKMENMEIQSYNLGINSFPAPQSFIFLEKIIEESEEVKYYFVELTPIYDAINNKILNTPEYHYWYDFRHLKLLIQHISSDSRLSRFKKLKLMKDHFQSYIGSIFMIGFGEAIVKQFVSDVFWLEKEMRSEKGYVSFEGSIKNNADKLDGLTKRKSDFLKDTTILKKRIELANSFKKIMKSKAGVVTPFVEEMNRIIEKAEQKGAKVFFIIPPRMEAYYGYSRYGDFLNNPYIIDLSDPDKYPFFYQTKYSFDKGHLNRAGAKMFTNELFLKFKAIK